MTRTTESTGKQGLEGETHWAIKYNRNWLIFCWQRLFGDFLRVIKTWLILWSIILILMISKLLNVAMGMNLALIGWEVSWNDIKISWLNVIPTISNEVEHKFREKSLINILISLKKLLKVFHQKPFSTTMNPTWLMTQTKKIHFQKRCQIPRPGNKPY